MTDTFDVACCIRNGSGGWFILNDSDHAPINVDSLTVVNGSSTAGYVQINYPTATKVGSLIVGQDESCAQNGYTAGASVDFANSKIRFALNGAAIAPNSMPGGNYNFWVLGKMHGSVTSPVHTVLSRTLNDNSADWESYTLVCVIPAAQFTAPTGTQTFTRLTMKGATDKPTDIISAYIGHKAASGDSYDFASTPTQIKVSGSGTFTLPQGGELVSDDLGFVWDKTSDIVIAFSFGSSTASNSVRVLLSGASASLYFKAASGDAGTVNKTGYGASSYNPGAIAIVSKVEMDGF